MNTVPPPKRRYSPTTSPPPLISRFFYTFSVLFFIFTTVFADNGDDAVYMSKLLKAITPSPTGWSYNIHFCKWNGVVCHQFGRVEVIKLPSSSLSGILPPDLSTLSNLAHIDLHNNSLTGPLPSLSNLYALQYAYLSHNHFTSIPDGCFHFLPALRVLNLSNNLNLTPWAFPVDDLSLSSSLQILDLEATNMIGSLPQEMFERFPSLETLVLSHNNFTGTIPQSLWKSPIRYLRLNNNQMGRFNKLSGTIEVISSMRNLSQAWLNNNAFTGPIPDLSNCPHLFDLQLHSNLLTGVVPPSLMALPSLNNVSLDNNRLQGPIPVFRKGVKATSEQNSFCDGPCDPLVMPLFEIAAAFGYPLRFISSWTGKYPCSYWEYIECTGGEKLDTVNWEELNLTGTISPAFANLTDLVNLTLSGNNLTGSIPQSLTTLSQLKFLDVSNNNLSGQVPNFPPQVKLNITGNALLLGGSPSKKTYARPIWIFAGASMFSVGIAVILVVICCKHKRYLNLVQKRIFNKTTLLDNNVEDFIQNYNLSVAKRYSYAEVKRITNSFRDKLGQGGYGVVYKASLPDGRQVAVKVINEAKGNGEEFINEVASISKTSHVNIVSLLGFCYELNKRALIYEFMPNGSLDKFIYRSGFPSAICNLDWNTLYQIVIGIARGLEYLHQGCTSRILHLDIKPQNILLDEDFCPKISDFGLAKICQKKDSIVSIPGTRGTIGYIAPEVFSRTFGGVSHKSDVYSYGMLILEMTGGRKNHDTGGSHTTEMYFPDWIYKDLEQGNTLVNWLAISEEENDMVRKITMVSLWCIQMNPSDRPSMKKVIEMLEGPLQSVPYPPKPILCSPQRPSLQISYVSSNNLLETSSMTLQKNVSIKSNDFNNDKNENVIVL